MRTKAVKDIKDILPFLSLITRANTKGIIEECILKVDKNGVGTICAVDTTDSLFVSVEEKNMPFVEPLKIGLRNLTLLAQYSGSKQNVHVYIEESKWIMLRSVKQKAQIKVLLINPSQVATELKGNENEVLKNILDSSTVHFYIDKKTTEKAIEHITLIGCESSVIQKNKNGLVFISSRDDEEKQFKVSCGRLDRDETEAKVEVYNQYLLAVLRTLSFDKETEVKVSFETDKPLVFRQGKKNIWGILPALHQTVSQK